VKYKKATVLNGPSITEEDNKMLAFLAVGEELPSQNFFKGKTQPAEDDCNYINLDFIIYFTILHTVGQLETLCPVFDSCNEPLLCEAIKDDIVQKLGDEEVEEAEGRAEDLREDYIKEFNNIFDEALQQGLTHKVALKGLKAMTKARKANDKVAWFVDLYQNAFKQHKRRGQIHVNPAAVQRRVGPSRSRKAQDRGRPRTIVGRIVKRAKVQHNLAAAVRANRANAIPH